MDLSYNGSVLATALYGPYGVGRYATGTMPSSKGYTGQRQDSGSGLDYYSARYYDPTIGRFVSADVWQGPDRYGYVGGNPETATDPTGYMRVGDPSGGDPGPQTDRPNYYKQYMQYYWNDDSAGSGNFGVADFLLSGGKMDPEEFIDGVALADYFGLTVIRPRRQEKRGVGEPDYLVGIKGNLDPLPGALFLPELNVSWLDVIGALKGSDTLHFPTAVELYTPQSGSADDPGAWENRRSPYGGPGILKEVYAKGRAQASIIAIDISNIDDTGKMSKDDMIAYANTAFNWPYEPKDKPSMVERVIFIRDGQVILDVQSDPYNPFGPPARTDAPPRPPVLA